MKIRFRATLLSAACIATTTLLSLTSQPASAESFYGQLTLVGYNFCPRETVEANGQLVSIAQNTALFSLYGTMYGGDGRTTFGLPDLRGRYPMHVGSGPGLTSFTSQGAQAGSENIYMTSASQLPSHNHNVQATNALANKKGPGSDFLAKVVDIGEAIYHDGPPNKLMDPAMITSTGASAGIPQRDPLQVMRWCVSTTGVYPSRN